MKNIIAMVLIVLSVAGLSACTDRIKSTAFDATVAEVSDGGLLVQPAEGADELRSADRIWVAFGDARLADAGGTALAAEDFAVGDIVSVTYSGGIRESYPAQITPSKVVLVQRG